MYKNYQLKNKKFIVIGTGTSGLVTAASLSFSFPNCEIVVVDKDKPEIIGVGEGTTRNFQSMMEQCGYIISDWFEPLQATFKLGVDFQNFGMDRSDVWHPFTANYPEMDDWAMQGLPIQTFRDKVFPDYLPWIRNHKHPIFSAHHGYGYHIDAHLLNKFLFEKLQNRKNVQFIFDSIVTVNYGNVDIEDLTLASGRKVSADLYFDGSGFAGVASKNKEKIDVLGDLFVDSAAVIQIPFSESVVAPAVTVASACDHGWIWTIPTRERIGSGLVFNKSCTTLDEARDTMFNFWQQRANISIDKSKIKILQWHPFYLKNPWHGNSVSVGLSSSFVEPLEATSLQNLSLMVDHIVGNVENYFVGSHDFIQEINNYHERIVVESIDFIRVHYETMRTDTPFWQYVRRNYKISERQRYYENLCDDPNIAADHITPTDCLFQYVNWSLWMCQQKHKKIIYKPNNSDVQEQLIRAQEIVENTANADLHDTLSLANFYLSKFS